MRCGRLGRNKREPDEAGDRRRRSWGVSQSAKPRRIDKLDDLVRKILRKSRSPWVAGLVGVGVGLPSIHFLAVLAIIATSGTPPSQKVVALVTFILPGSLVVLTPFVGLLIAPARTLDAFDRFGIWISSRSQIEYAGLLAAVGCLLIGLSYT